MEKGRVLTDVPFFNAPKGLSDIDVSHCGARKNTTQFVKYPRVLYVKPSIRCIYSYFHQIEDSWNVMSGDIRTAHFTMSFEI